MEFIIRNDDTNEILFTVTGDTIAGKVFTHLVKVNKDLNLSICRVKDGKTDVIKEGRKGECITINSNLASAYNMSYVPYVDPIPLTQ